MTQVAIDLSDEIMEIYRAMASTGKYGRTVEEILRFIVSERIFYLPDIKKYAILALKKENNHDDDWIELYIPGSDITTSSILKKVKAGLAPKPGIPVTPRRKSITLELPKTTPCSACGKPVPQGQTTCEHCGKVLTAHV